MRYQLYPHIIADPDILSGKPVVEGTQVPASNLLEEVASGKSLDEVARENGVTLDDVRAALAYGAHCIGEPVQAPINQIHLPDESAESLTAAEAEAIALGLDPATLSPLGRRLLAQRAKIVASGIPSPTWDEFDAEMAEMRRAAQDEQES